MTERCGVLRWRDRVRGGNSRLEIKLRSGEKAMVVACDMAMLAGTGKQSCWQCPGSKNVWVAYRHQLFKVSQEQLRMGTITERVADDVIHQDLRAIGENSAADGQVLPKNLDISRDPPPPSAEESTQTSLEERAERHERFENRSSGHVQQGNSAQSRE